MYNALDCASQKTALKEQPFLSNFIGSSSEDRNHTKSVKTCRPSPSGGAGAQQRRADKPSLPRRCVDPRRALGVPSRGIVHTPSPCTFSGEPSEVASISLSGVVPPRGACPSEVTTSVSSHGSALRGVVPPRNASPSQDERKLNVDKPTSLPRCIDPRRAVDLPSRGLARTPSPFPDSDKEGVAVCDDQQRTHVAMTAKEEKAGAPLARLSAAKEVRR